MQLQDKNFENTSQLSKLLKWLLIIVFIPMFCFHSYGILQLFVFPGEINCGEGIISAESSRLEALDKLYGDINQPPFWALTYPPGYHVLVSTLGCNTIEGQRLISLFCSLGQCLVLIVILRRITGNWLSGILASLMFVTSIFVAPWFVVGRTDMTGRFFSVMAIAVAFLVKDFKKAFIGALLLSIFAVLVKQTMFTGGIVSTLVLWSRNRKGGVIYAFLLGLGVAGSYFVIDLLSNGGFFKHAFKYTARGLDSEYFNFWVKTFLRNHWHYAITACVGIYVILKYDKSYWWLLAGLFPALLNAIAISNAGGDRNYLFDLIWMLCLLTALGVSYYIKSLANGVNIKWSLSTIVIMLAILVKSNADSKDVMVYPDAKFAARANDVIEELRKTRGPIICEYAGYEIAAGHNPEFPSFIMKALEERGLFDPQLVIDKISKKEYAAIMLSHACSGRYSERVMNAIRENYKKTRVIQFNYLIEGPADFYFLHPKTASDETTATISADTGTTVTPSS